MNPTTHKIGRIKSFIIVFRRSVTTADSNELKNSAPSPQRSPSSVFNNNEILNKLFVLYLKVVELHL